MLTRLPTTPPPEDHSTAALRDLRLYCYWSVAAKQPWIEASQLQDVVQQRVYETNVNNLDERKQYLIEV